MEFLEKSGNGVIQKSELKEALGELANEKTGSSENNKKAQKLGKSDASTSKSKRPALRRESLCKETAQKSVFMAYFYVFLGYMILFLCHIFGFFLQMIPDTTTLFKTFNSMIPDTQEAVATTIKINYDASKRSWKR